MGHSLGGMITSMWGQRHPEAAGVINLDGHGNPRPDQYVGLDPHWVAERRIELDSLQRQQLAALSGPPHGRSRRCINSARLDGLVSVVDAEKQPDWSP
jgi:pimeloyl-ACP methyl ester carboxylesterase